MSFEEPATPADVLCGRQGSEFKKQQIIERLGLNRPPCSRRGRREAVVQRLLWMCNCSTPRRCEDVAGSTGAEMAVVGSRPVIAAVTDHYYPAIMDRADLNPRQLYEQNAQWATA